MMRVRCILVETTVPVRIRPRIETRPVKGHFLSVEKALLAAVRGSAQFIPPMVDPDLNSRLDGPSCSLSPLSHSLQHTDISALNGSLRGSEAQADILVPSSATLSWLRRL